MANYTSTHTGAVIDASVTKVSSSGVTQADLSKLNAVTSTAVELNLLDGVTATTAELNILDGVTATAIELNYLDGADSSITTLSLPDNTTITTFGASLIDDADAATARTTLGVDIAGTDNSTDVTLVTTSHDYLSLSGQAITLGQIDISDDTNLVAGDGLALTGDTLSVNVDNSSIETNLDTLRVKALGITNAMLAGSIANSKLSNSSVSYGGVSVALGSSDATPAFDLSDATSLPIVAGTTGTLSVARGGTGATTASGARTNLNVDVAGTDNSTDVTLVTTSHDYLSLTGQAITLGQIDISDDTNLVGGTGITLTGDTLSTTDSEIVHDNLSGFVANEHIDHSGVSITAGAGLTGGGDITATRDIAVGAGTGVTVNADDVAIGQDVATTADVTFNSVTADIIGDIRGATKFQAKADVALNKGDAVYISGVSGTTPTVNIADANDSAKMPSFGLAASSVSINASVEIITFGTLAGINTSAFSVGDIIYISTNGTSGNTLTATAPSGETSLIQNIGKVQRSHATAGSIKVGGAGRSNATPNLNDGNIFIGNSSNQAVTASLNTKIESYLDGGTSTANFDTISVDGAEITATPAELNVLDGITSTTAELNYTDGVTSNIQTQLDAKAPLANPAFTGTATGANLTLSGDLTVNGSTTTLDTTNLAVEDNLMELNAGVTSNANDSGFLIERGTTGDNAIFMWDESADKFTLGTTTATGTTTGDIILSSTGTLVASLEGNVTGDVTGNADTATTLATARNFSLTGDVTAGAVSFDGSGNVALSTTIAANSVALGTDTTGNYMSDLTEGTGIDITHTPAEGSNATIALDLTEVGFGGGANRLITDDGDGTVTAESGLTYGGSALTLTGDLNISGYIYDSANSGNRLDLDDDSDAGQINQVALYGINHLNLVADNTNNGTGEIRFWKGAVSDLDSGTNTRLMTIDNSGNVRFNAGDVKLGATKKLYLDGGSDTYIHESAPNVFMLVSGGAERIRTTSTGNIVINEQGNSVDLRVEGNTDPNLLFVDGSADSVGIGTNSPGAKLHIKTPSSANADLFVEATDFTPTLRMYSGGANIGSLIRFGTGSGASKLRLQSITAGGGISGAVSDVMTLQENGNVGIGITSPSYLLHLSGTAPELAFTDTDGTKTWRARAVTNNFHITETGAGDPFVIQSGAGANALVINSSGNVGIGTNTPDYELDVAGDIGVDHVIYHNGDGNTYHQFTTDRQRFFAGGELLLDLYEDGTQDYVKLGDGGDVDINLNDDMFVEGSSGNVGIGTTSPSYTLDVDGNIRATGDLRASDDIILDVNANYIFLRDASSTLTRTFGMNASNNTYVGPIDAYAGGSILYGASSNVADQIFYTSGAERLRIKATTGNVGIGETGPTHKLQVASAGSSDSVIRINADNARGANRYALDIVDDDINSRGSVRVFTTSGIGMTMEADPPILQLNNTRQGSWTTGDDIAELRFFSNDASGIGAHSVGFIKMVTGTGSTSLGGEMTFGTGDYNTAATERMRIDEDGNVGIGTTSPTAKLDIVATGDEGLEVTGGSGYLSAFFQTDFDTVAKFYSSDGTAQIELADNSSSSGYNTIGVQGNGAMFFKVNNAERMRIDSQGNMRFSDNGTNPSAAANTAFLFNDGGEMKVLDELGNTTTISPHNFSLIPGGASEDRAWGYYSEKDIVDDEGNVTATQKVNVDMMKLARLVEQLTGEKLVYTEED